MDANSTSNAAAPAAPIATPAGRRRGRKPNPQPPPSAVTETQRALQAQRDAQRAEIQRQKEEARKAAEGMGRQAGSTTVVEDRSRWMSGARAGPRSAPLIETRVFCVAEARRFGDERLMQVRRVCQGDVFFEGHERGRWPESSPFACWHCGYHFDGPPMGMPTQWDERTDRVTMVGNFCSPSCCCAYIRYSRPYMLVNNSIGALQRLLDKSLGRSFVDIPTAPPRHVLERYGGWMTIEEFRNQGLYTVREMRKDEYVKEWIPQEVGITVWGRLVTLKGVTAEDVRSAVEKTVPAKRGRAPQHGLESFLACKRSRI